MPVILRVAVFLPWCLGFPLPPAKDLEGWDFVKDYFHGFFLSKKELALLTLETQTQFLQQFHPNATDLLAPQMTALLRQPHCGGPDGANSSNSSRKSKWNKHMLTYRIINYPRDMKPSTVKRIILKVVSIWSNVTLLIFQQVQSENADIKISFWKGAHGDDWPFDGPGGVLGHAFLPNSGKSGVVHFDKCEHWSVSNTGFNLFLVAIHELGHSLGLQHSKNRRSIMYSAYRYRNPRTFRLSVDDIKKIQQQYSQCLLEEKKGI
ncbi:LOW QUALITY PROTEIN: matrix metalloproteinase-26 [Carlito syrichta]|uniref:LOW QUALITY PROTEIN: matrix metalloproteinase-26 n=1 Tax=Carlito syrichta TaxID=1868482 RepID=A0A1U7TSQ7_CARSF|nr:LOW QUALITY PROTEIN: matrix metalloproteinase-26 [Carlito syrichta]